MYLLEVKAAWKHSLTNLCSELRFILLKELLPSRLCCNLKNGKTVWIFWRATYTNLLRTKGRAFVREKTVGSNRWCSFIGIHFLAPTWPSPTLCLHLRRSNSCFKKFLKVHLEKKLLEEVLNLLFWAYHYTRLLIVSMTSFVWYSSLNNILKKRG